MLLFLKYYLFCLSDYRWPKNILNIPKFKAIDFLKQEKFSNASQGMKLEMHNP